MIAAEATETSTHTGVQKNSHEPSNIHWPGESRYQVIKTHKAVPKDKAMLETQQTFQTSSVKRSSGGQSLCQLHVSATGMKILLKNHFLRLMSIK